MTTKTFAEYTEEDWAILLPFASDAQRGAVTMLQRCNGDSGAAAHWLALSKEQFKNRLKDLKRKATRHANLPELRASMRANVARKPERPYVAPPERLAAPELKSHLTKVLICPDIHLPYHSEVAWETFLSVLEGWAPDRLVFLGDGVDFYRVSRFAKKRSGRVSFEEEIEIANREFDRAAKCVPEDCFVDYLEGNHEFRLETFLSSTAPELEGILSAENALRIKARGWRWTPYKSNIAIGKLHFAHDVGYAGVSCARQSVAAFGGSIIFGHSHQAQTHYLGTMNGDRHVGMTCGWLGDPAKIDYAHQSQVAVNSQHGFGIAYVLADGTHWSSFVPIIDGKACVDGFVYTA